MTIQVLFFSVLRDVVGKAELTIELPEASTMQDLLDLLYVSWPDLARWDGSLLLALDQTYVKRDAVLHEQAEVAIMPPVQGG
jgi:molybdopterin synthase sulfur carrier subunit